MLTLLPLVVIPLVVMLALMLTHRDRYTLKEFFVLEIPTVLLLVGGYMLARWGAVQDTEYWNGRITSKTSGTQHCCHCHQECDTCTDADGSTHSCNCREVCLHPFDYWWDLGVSTGDSLHEGCSPTPFAPSYWENAYIGEPASVPHGYTNYLLADPDSVLLQSGRDGVSVPGYPGVVGRYHVQKVLPNGVEVDAKEWNRLLSEVNADLGHTKQVNINIVFTKSTDPSYADDLQAKWAYGKKNDVTFVIGTQDNTTIQWARVVTLSRVEMLKVEARDELTGMSLADPVAVIGKIRALVDTGFTRTPMKEFEYLMVNAKPSLAMLIVLYVLAIGISVGGSFYMIFNDPFGGTLRLRGCRPPFKRYHY